MPASRRFQSISWSGISSRNWLGIISAAWPHWARTAARVTYRRRCARVMPTYARRRSSASSLVSSSERECGNVPCSNPVRNTTGYSRPLAVCRVISVTEPESSPSIGSWSESATSAVVSRNPANVASGVFCSYSAATDCSCERFSTREASWGSSERCSSSSRPDLESTSATISEGLLLCASANSRNAVIRSRNALSCVAVRVGAPSSSTWSTPSKNVVACVSAYMVTNDSARGPSPRLGTLRMRRMFTSSAGLTMACR